MSIYKNTITLKRFLGANAVEHTNSNQKPIVVLSLATKSSYKDKQSSEFVSRTDWHRIVASPLDWHIYQSLPFPMSR
jgi:single-strand DNA-binding protein